MQAFKCQVVQSWQTLEMLQEGPEASILTKTKAPGDLWGKCSRMEESQITVTEREIKMWEHEMLVFYLEILQNARRLKEMYNRGKILLGRRNI